MSDQVQASSTTAAVVRRGRLPGSERAQRRREVLAAAAAVIVEHGLAAATMQAIAVRAGASKETLYAWFGDRNGLITAVIEANADASAAQLREALNERPGEGPGERPGDLAAAVSTLETYAEALLRLLTGAVSVALNRAAMSSPALAGALLAGGRHRVGPVAEQFFGRLQADGLIDVPDPGVAFGRFYGLVVQDTQIRVLLGDRPPTPGECRRRAVQAVEAFFACCGTQRSETAPTPTWHEP